MANRVIRMKESRLRGIVMESVRRYVNESFSDMEASIDMTSILDSLSEPLEEEQEDRLMDELNEAGLIDDIGMYKVMKTDEVYDRIDNDGISREEGEADLSDITEFIESCDYLSDEQQRDIISAIEDKAGDGMSYSESETLYGPGDNM